MKTKRSLASPTYWLSVVALGLLVGFSIQFAKAWVDPTGPPPGGNISGPITTGIGDQVKSAGLGLTGNMVVGGALQVSSLNAAGCDLKTNAAGTFYCGVDATGAGGDNLGNHTATTVLNMAGQNIYNLRGGSAIAWGAASGGGNSLFSDGANGNMAVRMSGGFYVQNQAGSGPAALGAGVITSYGNSLRTQSHSLNTTTDEWLRLGDGAGSVYAGKGFAADKLWAGQAMYANGNLCLNGDCRAAWPSSTPTLGQNSCYWEPATWNSDCTNSCPAGYYVAAVKTYKGESNNTGCGEGSLVAIPYCCKP